MRTGTGSLPSDRDREEWVRTRELRAREGISRATLWRWVEKGLLEVRRMEARTGVRVRVAERYRDEA